MGRNNELSLINIGVAGIIIYHYCGTGATVVVQAHSILALVLSGAHFHILTKGNHD